MGALTVCSALAGWLWPLQVWQFLSDQCWLPGKGHPGDSPALPGPGSSTGSVERAHGRLADLVKRKERPWGIFECEG